MNRLLCFAVFFELVFGQILLETKDQCGGQLTGDSGLIVSPKTPQGKYPSMASCRWQISAPDRMQIKFLIEKVSIEPQSPACPYDGFIIYDARPSGDIVNDVNDDSQISEFLGRTRFCGDESFSGVQSKTNSVIVHFYSDEDTEESGFTIKWKVVAPPEDQHDCNFEQGLCAGWKNLPSPSDDFDWELNRGNTRTSLTGPSFDKTRMGANGQYVYVESSLPQRMGDIAMLSMPTINFNNAQSEMCLNFWYHMYGPHIGTLQVEISNNLTSTISWFRTGQQALTWKKGNLTIPYSDTPTQIIFVGIRGNGHQGDIAIDDVTLRRSACEATTTTTTTQGMPTTDDNEVAATETSKALGFTPPPQNCTVFEYACISGVGCIPGFYLCDGVQDCPDNDDELNCPDDNLSPPVITTPVKIGTSAVTTSPNKDVTITMDASAGEITSRPNTSDISQSSIAEGCPPEYVACSAGNCIPMFWICDGEKDCNNGDDELNCPTDGESETTTAVPGFEVFDNETDAMVVQDTTKSPTSPQALNTTVSNTMSTTTMTKALTTRRQDLSISSTKLMEKEKTTTDRTTEDTTIMDPIVMATTETTENNSLYTTSEPSTSKIITSTITEPAFNNTNKESTVAIATSTNSVTNRTTGLPDTSRSIILQSTAPNTAVESMVNETSAVATQEPLTSFIQTTTQNWVSHQVSRFTPRPTGVSSTIPKSTNTLAYSSTVTGAHRNNGENGATGLHVSSLFILLTQTISTIFVAYGLCSWG